MKNVKAILELLKETQGKTMLAEMTQGYTKFQMLTSTILSARAKDEITFAVSKKLFKKYGTAQKLAKANPEEVKEIIRKIGFYNNKTKTIIETAKNIVDEFHGKVPQTLEGLMSLPGVGRKVANCVLVYAHGKEAIPVDTHVHRISNRLGWVNTVTPEETEKKLERIVPKKYWLILNDVFVNHGKNVCKPISPCCSECEIFKYCKKAGVKKSR